MYNAFTLMVYTVEHRGEGETSGMWAVLVGAHFSLFVLSTLFFILFYRNERAIHETANRLKAKIPAICCSCTLEEIVVETAPEGRDENDVQETLELQPLRQGENSSEPSPSAPDRLGFSLSSSARRSSSCENASSE